MAVVVQYVVVRKGEPALTTSSKKEADNHDKMLDVAEQISAFLESQGLGLSESTLENVGIALAKNQDVISGLFKGKSFVPVSDEGEKPAT